MHHPWIWLNESQHSAAVQAVVGIIATIAASIAGLFAYLAYSAAKEQAVHARTQAMAATQQLDHAVRSYGEERRLRIQQAIDNDLDRREQILRERAKDEAYAPYLSIVVPNLISIPKDNVPALSLQLMNNAMSDAFAVTLNRAGCKELRFNLVTAGTVMYFDQNIGEEPIVFNCTYKTAYGTVRKALLYHGKTEIIEVVWPVEIPDILARYGFDL
jgi:hypothetical protein